MEIPVHPGVDYGIYYGITIKQSVNEVINVTFDSQIVIKEVIYDSP